MLVIGTGGFRLSAFVINEDIDETISGSLGMLTELLPHIGKHLISTKGQNNN
ncbi:hypothetical protein [Oenococcus oeni]|uniref:hypothetical protein n=1 Tax=Oenococcus oeni TaxID=1247 RepID=UPI0015D663CD|nr:hypothetical protein [Oenococcus oeni]